MQQGRDGRAAPGALYSFFLCQPYFPYTSFFLHPFILPVAPPVCPQVSSLQVYDELLESALRAVGAGPRNLALHGPWLWLLDRFCESYAVGRNYARLSYLKWVVRPENATLTADCFEVLLRDMVALQQAAAVDGLSSGELGVQAQVGCEAGALWGLVAIDASSASQQHAEQVHAACTAAVPACLGPGQYTCVCVAVHCLPRSSSALLGVWPH